MIEHAENVLDIEAVLLSASVHGVVQPSPVEARRATRTSSMSAKDPVVLDGRSDASKQSVDLSSLHVMTKHEVAEVTPKGRTWGEFCDRTRAFDHAMLGLPHRGLCLEDAFCAEIMIGA
jgi:hypothetical protein